MRFRYNTDSVILGLEAQSELNFGRYFEWQGHFKGRHTASGEAILFIKAFVNDFDLQTTPFADLTALRILTIPQRLVLLHQVLTRFN